MPIACTAGGIARACYGAISVEIRNQSLTRLDDRLRLVANEFRSTILVRVGPEYVMGGK